MKNTLQQAIRYARLTAQQPLSKTLLEKYPHMGWATTCLGHRLAVELLQKTGPCRDGYDAWALTMEANRAHLIVMLRQAGTGPDPLSHRKWHLTPQTVWRHLESIQSLPSLVKADLRKADLLEADLHGTDLSGANLFNGRMELANLEDALLQETNMQQANLTFANLQNANMTNANLRKANLRAADLRGAILKEQTCTKQTSRAPI